MPILFEEPLNFITVSRDYNCLWLYTIIMNQLRQTFYTVDQMKRMECSYVCEVLHFLLKKRLGTPLVKLSVDLVDVDNEASLNLLCALFKHREYH